MARRTTARPSDSRAPSTSPTGRATLASATSRCRSRPPPPPDPSRAELETAVTPQAAEPVAPGRLHEAVDRPDDQPVRRRDHRASRCRFVAITILGANAFQMGILGVVRFLPWILFTLPAGVWVDRMRRRPILIGADVARAALLATIPIAFLGGWLTIWQIYVVSLRWPARLEVFFDIAYQSYLPSIVERDELVEGNSKLELSRAGSSVDGSDGRRLPDRAGACADRDLLRRAQLPRRRAVRGAHPARRAAAAAARSGRGQAAEHVAGGASGPRLRRAQPVPAQHRRVHRHAQPVRQHRRRPPAALPRGRARD